jgi:hypothetical protein
LKSNVNFRAATAALVEKQSKEMMNLINEKRSEFMRAESLYIDDDYQTEELFPYPSNPPAPQPPGVAKTDIYHNPLVFADIDQIAISVTFPTIFLILKHLMSQINGLCYLTRLLFYELC